MLALTNEDICTERISELIDRLIVEPVVDFERVTILPPAVLMDVFIGLAEMGFDLEALSPQGLRPLQELIYCSTLIEAKLYGSNQDYRAAINSLRGRR